MYIGFDIGGTNIKAVLVKNRKIIRERIEITPKKSGELFDLISKIKNELVKNINLGQIKGIGFSLAGALDKKRKRMLNSPNMKFLNNKPLKKILERKLKPYPIKIEHDVYCFLLAEKKAGIVKNIKNAFYLTLGTDIGSAFTIDGKIQTGFHGAAGEAGHMIIDVKNNFDLGKLASNKFIKKHLDYNLIKAVDKLKKRDKRAIKVYKKLSLNLGVGIANIINIIDPEMIILSGGITGAKNILLPGIKRMIKKFVISPESKKTKILFSKMNRFGGALGAALLFEPRH
ncbi:ROK family protein [Candidatus Wolfebacteria bacterium]|nr:ROK family protein [Candidatus Wolfebacteria bacterium]